MKRNSLLFVVVLTLCACVTTKPRNFTYEYDNQQTELGKLIRIDGYYTSQRGCDSSFSSIFMFYTNGLFTIATGSKVSDLEACFGEGGNSIICKYPSWGTYRIYGDTIKTQTVRTEGVATCTIFRDYKIDNDRNISNISDYIDPQSTNMGNMTKYPSFTVNPCPQQLASFHPLSSKRDSLECPLLKTTWFSKK